MHLTGMNTPTPDTTPAAPIRVGLVHGHLAARSKWPLVSPSGRPLDWRVMDDEDAASNLVDIWVVGTQGHRERRMDTVRCLTTSASPTPVLVLLTALDDASDWLALRAEGYHETGSPAALLAQRLEALLPAPVDAPNQLPTPAGLIQAEAQFWESTFNMAGAGLITGRSTQFLSALERVGQLGPMRSRDEAIGRIHEVLSSVTWELNNPKAKALLELHTPVSLDCGFVHRITPIQPQALLADLLTLGKGNHTSVGDVVVRKDDGSPMYLSLELSLPQSASDTLLLTLLDISHRVELESTLRDHVNHLEERVEQRTLQIRQAKAKLESEGNQRQRLADQVRQNLVHITQGVISAKAILGVALPGKEDLRRHFPESLFIERPRDILGGDFLFMGEKNGQRTLALIDSTGHGVPGSMVALLGSMLINRAFAGLEVPTPSEVLRDFRLAFDQRMNRHSDVPQMFGFDGAVITVDAEARQLQFSGARGDLILIRDGQAQVIRGTRESIDLIQTVRGIPTDDVAFETHVLEIQPGDQVYLATDGIRDQFGGVHGRKLGRKRLADLLERHAHLPISERESALLQELLRWKGGNAKVDDATLVGIDLKALQVD